jgi:hypothetical protein
LVEYYLEECSVEYYLECSVVPVVDSGIDSGELSEQERIEVD